MFKAINYLFDLFFFLNRGRPPNPLRLRVASSDTNRTRSMYRFRSWDPGKRLWVSLCDKVLLNLYFTNHYALNVSDLFQNKKKPLFWFAHYSQMLSVSLGIDKECRDAICKNCWKGWGRDRVDQKFYLVKRGMKWKFHEGNLTITK